MKRILSFLVFAFVFGMKANANVTVFLSGLNPQSQQIIAGAQDVPIFVCNISRQGADSVVTSLSFQSTGISDDNTAFLSLYNQGSLLATGLFSNGQVTFSGLHISLKTINAMIEIRVNVNANTNSASIGINLIKLSTTVTNQSINLASNVHFISISPIVFGSNIYPVGWQVSLTGNYPQTIWGNNFSVSTTDVTFDTMKFTISGTLPLSSLSNINIWINSNFLGTSYNGQIIDNKIIFVMSSGQSFSPGIYYININADIAPCSIGTFMVSMDDQKDVKYHTSTYWQLYTPSGVYPAESSMTFTPCFSYYVLEDNSGTNAYFAKFILQNVAYSAIDSTPNAALYLWDSRSNSSITVDSIKLYWNGSSYEGLARFSSLEAEHQYNWQVVTVVDGIYYYQNNSQQSNFWFSTKTCYEAHAGTTKVDTVTTKSAVISAKLQYPHQANGSEFYSSFNLLNEDKVGSYPTSDTSLVFGTMWKTPLKVTDTVSGTYFANGLDSCTNYSYWFEWRQPCGGIIKSEVGHFRTKGKCHTTDKKLFIFPNPAKDYITIRFDYGRDNYQEIRIYDVTGRWIKTEKVINSQQTIDINKLPPGMYIVKTFRKGANYEDMVYGKFIKTN